MTAGVSTIYPLEILHFIIMVLSLFVCLFVCMFFSYGFSDRLSSFSTVLKTGSHPPFTCLNVGKHKNGAVLHGQENESDPNTWQIGPDHPLGRSKDFPGCLAHR